MRNGKPKKRGLIIIVTVILIYILKKKFYDRLISASKATQMIADKQIHNVRK